MNCIAKPIHHVENRVQMRSQLPRRWEHRDRVEDTSEIGERCEDEVRNDRGGVETIGYQSVQESYEREEERSEKREDQHETDMCELEVCEEECNREDDTSCGHPSDHPSSDEAENHHPIGSWRYEDLFDRLLELRHIER